MGKGYAEGPAAEEAERRREEIAAGRDEARVGETRDAVYGSTADEPEKHFLGWLGEVDPDALFTTGAGVGPLDRPPQRLSPKRLGLDGRDGSPSRSPRVPVRSRSSVEAGPAARARHHPLRRRLR